MDQLQEKIRQTHEVWLEEYLAKQIILQTLKTARANYREALRRERSARAQYEALRLQLINERVGR